jgi:outer membrane lipoprotein SlyB
MLKKIGISVLALSFAGCASTTGWMPTVDTYGDPNASMISANMADCQNIAKQASGWTPTETGKGALVGGLLGAAAGAAIGAAAGHPGKGAAIGAAAGGIGGGTYKGAAAEDNYKRAYRDCMRRRGHNVSYN